MTNDEAVLGLLRDGRLRVCLQTGRVWALRPVIYCNPKAERTFKEKVATPKPGSNRLRFHFTVNGRKFTMYKSHLLLLTKLGRPIEVADHRDGNRTNDDVDNLGEHTFDESNRQGREAQRRRVVEDAENFFEYIAFWGEEPPDVYPCPAVRKR